MPHFNGSKQGKKKPVKKIKQVNNGEHRHLEGGDVIYKPIAELQFNVPKGVADDKKIRPAEVFEGYVASKKDNKSKSKSKSNKSNK
tara:strand:+ start:536 stop:793 length:258 start_codon:yes stop_codon:yes gene_type:complete